MATWDGPVGYLDPRHDPDRDPNRHPGGRGCGMRVAGALVLVLLLTGSCFEQPGEGSGWGKRGYQPSVSRR